MHKGWAYRQYELTTKSDTWLTMQCVCGGVYCQCEFTAKVGHLTDDATCVGGGVLPL